MTNEREMNVTDRLSIGSPDLHEIVVRDRIDEQLRSAAAERLVHRGDSAFAGASPMGARFPVRRTVGHALIALGSLVAGAPDVASGPSDRRPGTVGRAA